MRGPDRLRRKRRKEAEARARAEITTLPLTPENLHRLFTAGMETARAEGFDSARDGVHLAVRSWFVSVADKPTGSDPEVRALLDELDPAWRRVLGVEQGSHAPTPERVDHVGIVRSWATAGDVEQFVEHETGRFWVAADSVDRLLTALDPGWPEFSARVEARKQEQISNEAREDEDPVLFDFGGETG